jgi:hypothetical protein
MVVNQSGCTVKHGCYLPSRRSRGNRGCKLYPLYLMLFAVVSPGTVAPVAGTVPAAVAVIKALLLRYHIAVF